MAARMGNQGNRKTEVYRLDHEANAHLAGLVEENTEVWIVNCNQGRKPLSVPLSVEDKKAFALEQYRLLYGE